jgi:integrase
MQIEPFPEDDGYRCWLSRREQDRLTTYYTEHPTRRLAIELMLDGLRSEEVPRVEPQHIRSLDVDEEAYKLQIPTAKATVEDKTGWRECPIATDTRQRAIMLKNTRGLRRDEPLVDKSKRQIQRWVTKAAGELADEGGEPDDWGYVTAHDLRRTWATYTFYRLFGNPGAIEVIMRWGGWRDRDTFRENYIGREPDDLAVELMDQAGLR